MSRLVKKVITPGVCTICGCSDGRPCPCGCSWANADRTLCSHPICVEQAQRNDEVLSKLISVLDWDKAQGPTLGKNTRTLLEEAVALIPNIDRRVRKHGGAA